MASRPMVAPSSVRRARAKGERVVMGGAARGLGVAKKAILQQVRTRRSVGFSEPIVVGLPEKV